MASDSEEIVYQSLGAPQYEQHSRPKQHRVNQQSDDDEDNESEISLQEEQGFLVHLSPEANKTQWNHVDDLDKFFAAVYDYHQRHGFQNMILAEVLQLLQFLFIVVFATYLSWCVNYPELFDEIPHNVSYKKSFDDITYSFGTCVARFNFLTWFLLVLCVLFLLGRTIKMTVNFCNYFRTRNFFISALNIETRELSNMTWHEVQTRLLEVQKEQQICIHKQELTQLDIYHRILRFKNYMVAMVNKDVLPLKFRMPLLGQHAVLTHGMRFNLDVLLYWSPWSVFINSYTLRQEYKIPQKRKQLADQLANHIVILALLNLLLCPLIFLYQIIYFFFRYAEFMKRSPSFLGSRQWANYGRLYLRHFNELDHELSARLNRAYVPSKMYMNIFTSPSLIILAKYIAFFAGAPAAVLFFFGILDLNDVTKVEHLFTVASICGMVATVSSSLIPDENEVHCPEQLLMSILTQIHYMPDHWKGHAHTSLVRDEFAALFQYKLMYLLEELFSPILTPFWLIFCLRSKSTHMVDFFRSFTVEVAGVGDVCSFAQMDIKKHGNPQWKPDGRDEIVPKAQQAENGKTEMSLMHFTTLNPEWRPPQESNAYIAEIKHDVQREMPAFTSIIPDPMNLPSLGLVNPIDPSLMTISSQHNRFQQLPGQGTSLLPHSFKLRGGLSTHDGPLPSAIPVCMSTSGSFHSANFAPNYIDEGQRELLAGNMSLSVLHIHDVHHRRKRSGHYYEQPSHVQEEASSHQGSSFNRGGFEAGSHFPHHYQQKQISHQFDGSMAMSGSSNLSMSTTSVLPGHQRPHDMSELSHLRQYQPVQSAIESSPHVMAIDFGTSDDSPYSNPFPQNLMTGDEESNIELSSLPPLETPGINYPRRYGSSSHNSPASGASALNKPNPDPMPQIKEDNGEHELDNSLS